MATVRQAIDIMGEFYDRERANEDWRDWFIANDIAIPLAWLAWRGIATPTEESVPFIDETWQSFCRSAGIDHHASFDTLDEFLDFLDQNYPETT